jgi:hypothetical protein
VAIAEPVPLVPAEGEEGATAETFHRQCAELHHQDQPSKRRRVSIGKNGRMPASFYRLLCDTGVTE